MAKGNMLLGQARGKVGDIVFSRNNGQQVVRARAAVVKNPQTEAQVLQRILLNTVAQGYSKMIGIADHSFEGVSVGQQTQSAFMRRNLNTMRARIARIQTASGSLSGIFSFAPLGTKALTINPWIMSEGSLPQTTVSRIGQTTDGVSAAVLSCPNKGADSSYSSVAAALNLQRGDQLTFCQLSLDPARGIVFNYARVIFDPENADGSAAGLDSSFILGGQIGYPSSRNQGSFAALEDQASELLFNLDGNEVVGACVIVSREGSDGSWKRSSQAMKVVDDPGVYGEYSLLDAINIFNSGGISVENAYYLNGADNLSATDPSGAAASTPSLQSIAMAGGSLYSAAAGTLQLNQASYGLSYAINNFSNDSAIAIIFTPRTVAAGAELNPESGDLTVNCTAASGTAQVTFEQGVLYRPYFVIDGHVVNILRPVQWPSNEPADNTQSNITSVRLNGTAIAENATSQFSEGSNTIVAEVAAGTDGLTYEIGLVDLANATVGTTVTTTDKAAVSGDSATLTYTAALNGASKKLVLMQNNVIKQVWAQINGAEDQEGGY